MSRTLYFEQITDDRFDTNIKELLENRVEKLKNLLNIDGVEVKVFLLRLVHFDEHTGYWEDGTVAYVAPASNQYRCRFEIRKNTTKVSWDDIYKIVNSVKAVSYHFI